MVKSHAKGQIKIKIKSVKKQCQTFLRAVGILQVRSKWRKTRWGVKKINSTRDEYYERTIPRYKWLNIKLPQ